MKLSCLVFIFFLCQFLSAQLSFELPRKTISKSSAEVGVADFNHDGTMDVAISGTEQRWYEGPNFTVSHKIGDSEGGPYAARVADINGDGWDDFITSDGTRTQADVDEKLGELYVYLNPGGSGGDPNGLWQRIIVYQGDVRHQNDLRIVDMDGDGRLDIIEKTWSSERVVVALQNADINNWTVLTYDTGETGLPEGISAGDIDGDGDMEIVLSGVYWDNPGGWRTGPYTEHLIDSEFLLEEVKSAVGDLDGDGDNDIYMGSAEYDYLFLAWYENDGADLVNGGTKFIKHLIEDNQGDCHMVDLKDIDKDGDLDICTARSFSSKGMLIYYNDGNGNFTKQDFDSNGQMYTGVVEDLDQDGDLDYIGPYKYNGNVVYYINNTPGSPPDAPSNLVAILVDGLDISLTWDDLSNNEGSFVIERLDNTTWIALGTVSADVASFTDSETQAQSSYQYRLYAANFAGNSDTIISSVINTWPFSGEVLITPPSGNYVDPPLITLSSLTNFDEIRYTLDGSDPNESSTLYTAPFLLNNSATLSARSFASMLIASPVSTQTYNVAVNGNFPPMAEAGPDQNINEFITVTLDATASTDIDDQNTLIYLWTQISGPSISLANTQSEISSFLPSEVGVYSFEIQVSDEALSDRDTVTVVINDLSEDLVAYWPLDDISGNATELVNGNDAVPTNGISYVENGGKVKGAVSTDGGLNTRLLAPSVNVPGDSMTITFWMRADNLNSVEGRMLSKASGSNAADHIWMISLNGGSQLRFRLNTSSGGTTTLVSNSGEVVAGQWYFITVWYDGITMKILKNKVQVATVGKTGNISQAVVPVAIGNQPPSAGERPFPGLLDDVRIFAKALSASEIEEIYNKACANYVLAENQTFAIDQTLTSGDIIELDNISVENNAVLTLRCLQSVIGANVSLSPGAELRVINENGCE